MDMRAGFDRERRRWGVAWISLIAALAIHATDEAVTDFLSLWNPFVASLRDRFGWSPLPEFHFGIWLAGLAMLLIGLIALSKFVFRGVRWMRPASYVLASIVVLNGIGHLAASVYLGRAAPGAYSAPLLLVAAGFLLVSVRRYEEAINHADCGLYSGP